jgi:hypothetical protein
MDAKTWTIRTGDSKKLTAYTVVFMKRTAGHKQNDNLREPR